jgi:uncharacterized repeat protein (TIGR02543 family)
MRSVALSLFILAGLVMKVWAAAPTLSSYQLLYETTSPNRASNGAIVYTSGYGTGANDAAAKFDAASGTISRIRYRLELTIGGTPYYAEATCDAWTGVTAADLRIPDEMAANKFILKRNVSNLSVSSNFGSVTTGTGLSGRLEIWPYDYGTATSGDSPVGNGSTYDFDDTPSEGNRFYGSFQVHNLTNSQTVLAWNRHGYGAAPDIGFGNDPSGSHPDWTFDARNGVAGFKVQIWVESGVPAQFLLTEDVAGNLTYSGTPFADSDSASLTVTLSVADGTITGAAGTGITVGGTATARTFTGSVADLNTYFTTAGKITYQGAADNTSSRTLTTTVSDGTSSVSATSTLSFVAVDDAPTLSSYQLIYQAISPSRDGSGAIVYSTGYGTGASDAAAQFVAAGSSISRIRYRMELTIGGTPQYADVSFDPWSGVKATDLRIPDDLSANRFILQRNVSNLTVASNSSSVTTGSGLSGRLEIWPYNYAQANSGLLPAGSASTYDYDDTPSPNSNGHGSFQVHNLTNLQTVLAWNMHRYGGPPEIGFGNAPSGSPDWTGKSSNGSTGFKVQIWVESGVPSQFSLTEDVVGNLTFGGTPFADVDSPTLTVKLAVPDGTISGAAGTGITVGGTATARTFSGAVADLNTYFTTAGKITYLGPQDASGDRTLTTSVSDGTTVVSATSTITLAAVNDAPVMTASSGSTAVTRQIAAAIDSALTVTDVDNATLASATATISSGFQSNQDVLGYTNDGSHGNIAGSFNSSTGVLTLTSSGATATLAQWQAALRAVTYTNSSSTPTYSNRTVSFVVNDGNLASTAVTKTVALNLAVTYDSKGGSAIASGVTAVGGTLASSPGTPTRAGYTFVGWSLSSPTDPGSISGLYSRFKAVDYDANAKVWTDSSGNGRSISAAASLIGGTPALITTSTNNGNNRTFSVVSGGTSESLQFNNPSLSDYTLFTVARYSGNAKKRIFTGGGNSDNWLAGFWDGNRGVAHYNSFLVGAQYTSLGIISDWLVSTSYWSGGTGYYRANGAQRGVGGTLSSLPPLCVNTGRVWGEVSDFEIAEVLIYNRTLTSAEISLVESYIGSMYGITGIDGVIQFPFTHGQSTDFTVSAMWSGDLHTVTFDPQNGSAFSTVGWATGSALVLPVAPTRSGYSFMGWFTAASGGTKVGGAGASYTPSNTSSFTLYAQWSVPTLTAVSTLTGGTEDTDLTITHAALLAASDATALAATSPSFRVESVTSGTLTKGGVAVVAGTTLLGPNETLVWRPAVNANGTLDAFTVKAWDGSLASASAVQVKVAVAAVNDAPVLAAASSVYTRTASLSIGSNGEATLSEQSLVPAGATVVGVSLSLEYSTYWNAANNGAVAGCYVKLNGADVGGLGWTAIGTNSAFVAVNTSYVGPLSSYVPGSTNTWKLGSAWNPIDVRNISLVVYYVQSGVPALELTGTEDTTFAFTQAMFTAAFKDVDSAALVSVTVATLPATGTLKLSGTAVTQGQVIPLANLGNLTYEPAANENGAKTFTVTVSDGQVSSSAATVRITLAAVNDAPVMTASSGVTAATKQKAVAVDAGLTVTDADSTALASATVTISSGFVSAEDLLSYTNDGSHGNISGSFNASTGVLTLSSSGASATVAQWQSAVRAVTYTNSSGTPTFANRTVTFVVSDGNLASAAVAKTVSMNLAVTYDSKGGSAISSGTTTVGGTISASPGTPTRAGYTFVGWSLANVVDPATVSGLYSRFRAADYNASSKVWLDSSGNGRDISAASSLIGGSPTLVTTTVANGSSRSFQAVAGDGTTWLKFNNPILTDYTLFTVARYSGSVRGRIFNGASYNWLSGFYGGSRGVAFYEGWLTSANLGVATDWLASTSYWTGGTGYYRANGVQRATGGGYSGLPSLGVNAGSYSGEVSQYEIAEVLIFNRTLSSAEISRVEQYIGSTYGLSGMDSVIQFPYAHGQTSDFTLSALWTGNSNTVAFDAQGGSAVSSVTWSTGNPLTLPSSTRSGYSLAGWYDAPTGGTKVGSANASYTPTNTAGFTLYAQWYVPTLTSVGTLTGGSEDTDYTITHAALLAASDAALGAGLVPSFRVEAVSSGTLTKSGAAVVAGTTLLGPNESLVWRPATDANGTLNAFSVKVWDGTNASATAVQVKVAVAAVNDAPTMGDGASAASAASSAMAIKTLTGTNTNGVYWIMVNGVPTQVYCIMDSAIDGGGWMLAMKGASGGATFAYSSTHWTTTTTLNPTYLRGNSASVNEDAKFDVFNYTAADKVMAIFPDVSAGLRGGAVTNQSYGYIWIESMPTPANTASYTNRPAQGTYTGKTLRELFAAEEKIFIRDATAATPYKAAGTGVFSAQSDVRFFGFNYKNANGGNGWNRARFGFGWNENGGGLYPNGNETSNDVSGGIGLDRVNWSAGDYIGCCQNATGVNRSMQFELYVKSLSSSSAGSAVLTSIAEDVLDANNSGTSVSALTTGIADGDASAVKGLAVTAVDETNGKWYYTTDGSSWLSLTGASTTSARLLKGDDANYKMRFVPNANFNGTATFTYRAWDQTSGTAGQTADVTTNGGSTAYSSTTATSTITVTSINDSPVAANATLTAIDEDVASANNPGNAVSTLVAGCTDADTNAVKGMAVTAVDESNGKWYYSVDAGVNWLSLTGASPTAARLLKGDDANYKVRFVPNANYNGTATFTFRAWDQTTGTASQSADVTTNGGSTAYSATAATATITINSVNDAPTLTINLADGLPMQSAAGGTLIDLNGNKIHKFTASGSFTPAFSGKVEVLVVGGGGGGAPQLGGGGGGGGVVYMPAVSVVAGTAYPIVVGAGGAASANGQASTAFGATAAGGGTSGPHDSSDGTAGGSGGGAASNNSRLNQGGASSGNSLGGNTGTIYGNRGGNMTAARTGDPTRAAGGGGAGGQGKDTNSNVTGDTGRTGEGSGGIGIANSILGAEYLWGAGGGGGSYAGQIGGYGGLGGGGGAGGNGGAGSGGASALSAGADGSGLNGGAGGANTGGGGGGGAWNGGQGGPGGSGIVVVRYAGSSMAYQDTPVADTFSVYSGSLSATDAENDPLTFGITNGTVANGLVKKVGTFGTLVVNAATGAYTYTPDSAAINSLGAGVSTSDVFMVTVTDGKVSSPTTSEFRINVTGSNEAPSLTTLATLTGGVEDTDYTITYAALAAAGDEADPDNATVSFRVEAVTFGTLTKGGVAVVPGTTVLGPNESLVWRPAANAFGTLDAFTVKAWDGTTASATAQQVKVEVAAVNDAPTLAAISVNGTEDTVLAFAATDFTSKYADVEGTALVSVTVVTLPATGTLKLAGGTVTPGQVIPVADLGNLTYVPALNDNGAKTFTVKASDGDLLSAVATVTINIAAVNDAPLLGAISVNGTEGKTVTFTTADFTAKYSDPENSPAASITIATLPASGVLKLAGTPVTVGQTIPISSLATISTQGLVGRWSFDSAADLTTNAVTGVALTNIGGATWVAGGRSGGALSLNGSQWLSSPTGTIQGLPVGGSTYTVALWFKVASGASFGPNGFIGWGAYGTTNQVNAFRLDGSYQVVNYWWDRDLNVSVGTMSGDVWYHVAATYDGTRRSIYFNGQLVSSDSPSAPNVQALNFGIGKTANQEYFNGLLDEVVVYSRALSASEITAMSSQASGLTYEPASNEYGIKTFTVTASDGALSSAAATVSVNLAVVNQPPVLAPVAVNGTEDATVSFAVSDFTSNYSDREGMPFTSLTVATLPATGTLKLAGTSVSAGQVIPTANLGTLTYVPALNENGAKTFTVKVSDGDLLSAATTVTMTLAAVNDAPVAVNGTLTPITEDVSDANNAGTAVSAIASGCTDLDANALKGLAVTSLDESNGKWFYTTNGGLNWLSLTGVSETAARLLKADDPNYRVRFVPNLNFNGTATFTFRAWDQTSGTAGQTADVTTSGGTTAFSSATATATLTVTAVNDAPTLTIPGGVAATGGTVTQLAGTAIHTFTSSGIFTPSTSGIIELLVVGGGGAGGSGGGGGGGVVQKSAFAVTAGQPIQVVVGAGGAIAPGQGMAGTGINGGDSSFGSVVAFGGGGGGGFRAAGLSGASSGGSGADTAAPSGQATQGYRGADGAADEGYVAGGGGGGAGGPGTRGLYSADGYGRYTASSPGGDGGVGVMSTISGTAVYYGGGGGGGANTNASDTIIGGLGGLGGGGAGARKNYGNGNPGAPGTGGGGGGGDPEAQGGAGGSGIVIVSYTFSGRSYTDTVANDSFAPISGVLSGADVDVGDVLSYGIGNGTSAAGIVTKVGTYGTLAVTSASGAYTFTPNASAINALSGAATETFTVTVSDGIATTSAPLTFNFQGANDAPTATVVVDDQVQTFKSNGTFVAPSSGTVEYLIVGGGGGGGAYNGGGGAGGLLSGYTAVVAGQSYPIVVGAGGAGESGPNSGGSNGGDSSFNGLIAKGGGKGSHNMSGSAGGSGGGSGYGSMVLAAGVLGQGNTGGAGMVGNNSYSGGGGGGAGGPGGSATSTGGGAAGPGLLSSISGSAVYYAVGGPGSSYRGGDGARLIDGAAAPGGSTVVQAGAPNTGNGGGGGVTMWQGMDGGSGVVILRYGSAAVSGSGITFTDTAAKDAFPPVSGSIVGLDVERDVLTYGLSGIAPVAGTSSQVGRFGTLSVVKDTGRFTYTPDAAAINALSASATETFKVTVSDGTNLTSLSLTIKVTGVNDTPTVTVPGSQAAASAQGLAFGGQGRLIEVGDVDDSALTVTVATTNGALTLGSTRGLVFSQGNGTANQTMTFAGEIAALNEALSSLRVDFPENFAGNATLSLSVKDASNATATGQIAVTVTDSHAPRVLALSPITAAGHYRAGSVLDLQVTFTEPVFVTTTGGAPTLKLATGDVQRTAVYTGGSQTDKLTFRYTVQAGDTSPDLNHASTTALELNGAVIRDSSANSAVLTLPDTAAGTVGALATNAQWVIDTTAPTVVIGSPSLIKTDSGPVTFAVTYADLNGITPRLTLSDVTLVKTGDATGVLAVSGSGTAWTVTISNITGDGTLAIALAAGTASDPAGNLAPAAGTSETFLVENILPVKITAQPVAVSANQGDSARFAVATTGRPAATYQWRKGGVAIPGATLNVLVLHGLVPTDAESYDVIATNIVGPVTSSAVALTVTPRAGDLFGAGLSQSGSLGDLSALGNLTKVALPLWTAGSSQRLLKVAAQGQHTLVLAASGKVYGIGSNYAATLGIASNAPSYAVPELVLDNVRQLAVAENNSYFLRRDGTLWGTGVTADGMVGEFYPGAGSVVPFALVPGVTDIVGVWAGGVGGDGGCLFLRRNGDLFLLGGPTDYEPRRLATGVVEAAQGEGFRFWITTDGALWAQGDNTFGQLGTGNTQTVATPSKVVSQNVARVFAGPSFAFFIKSDGTLWAMGRNTFGQLGLGTTSTAVATPTQVPLNGTVTQVATGARHAAFIKGDGSLWAMGSNYYGQLGDGSMESRLSPVKVADNVLSLSAGDYYSTFLAGVAPRIEIQPVGRAAVAGESVSMSVAVSGTPVLNYLWKKDGVALSGATQAILTLPNISNADAGLYEVQVTNEFGSAVSNRVGVTVSSVAVAPAITAQPVDRVVQQGANVSLTVQATGSSPLRYQWRKGGTAITGATDATLTLASVQFANVGTYDVVVSNTAGSATSAPAALSLTGLLAPEITTQPKSQYANPGSTVTLSVVANGTGLSYHWYKQGVMIAGETRASLSLASVQTSDAGVYWVVVSNSGGAVTSDQATLTVDSVLGFMRVVGSPAILANGGTVVLELGTSFPGSVPVQLGWSIVLPPGFSYAGGSNEPDVKPLIGNTGTVEWAYFNIPASGSTFRVTLAYGPGIVGRQSIYATLLYRTNALPTSVTLPPAVLSRVDTPVILKQPTSVTVVEGLPASFSVSAQGGELTYQWFRNGEQVAGATTASLNFKAVALTDAGDYKVRVTNTMGSVDSAPARLAIYQVVATQATVGTGYVEGQTLRITNTITFSGGDATMGWQTLLPQGWTFVGSSGDEGDVKPLAGSTDLLEWAWTGFPISPVKFTYTVKVPMGTTGPRSIASMLSFVRSGAIARVLATPDPLVVLPVGWHSADLNQDGRIDIMELLRVIELYNTRHGTVRTGAYQVGASTEDGFAADFDRDYGVSVSLPSYHTADSNRDGRLSLVELLRVIELFSYAPDRIRTGQYHRSAETDDGFASGP